MTPQDLQAFAARIRLHFEPQFRGIAEEFALEIARTAGLHTKQLRPETTLDEILGWIGTDSLDHIEAMMAIEEALGYGIPDRDADRSAIITFGELVVQIARKRGVV